MAGPLGGLILKPTVTFSAEAQAVIDLMTGLTGTEKNAIATFVDAEVLNGNWNSNYDEFYCFGLVTEANALVGWKGIKTATNNGATKTANGFVFDGTSDWINSNWAPSVDGVKFTLDDALSGVFLYDGASLATNDLLFGTNDTVKGARVRINHSSANQLKWAVNNNTVVGNKTFKDSNISYMVARLATNSARLYENAIIIETTAGISTALADFSIAIAARNQDDVIGNFALCTLSSFIVGSQIGFDHSGFNTNLNTLLTDLGVI